ncbi:Plasmodium vivax Vir protein, putative [Plasmodium vivax]|uniref:Vir protein, putative n=1 Tax=Plasmodium vivax TaxID=5855 RepID=A0A1G4EA14_PLAVI|nr:Plasmodium vivax Vir protein, putative [Plasmodium vivax]
MTNEKQKTEKVYDFFEEIGRYIIDGKSIEDTIPTGESSSDCDTFSEYWGSRSGNKVMAKYICDHLVSLYNYLSNKKAEYINDSNYQKDFAFLNYWINWKIYGDFNENISAKNFYDNVESHALHNLQYYLTNTLIHDIDKDDLNKMNKLYNLYEKYSKLNAVIDNKLYLDKESFLSLSIACCTDYNYISYLCNDSNENNNSIFCQKLKTFQTKYEQLHNNVGQKKPDFSDSLIKLSECPNNKIISTAVTVTVVGLIPLIGVLYKFTPMGQVLRSKMGILNNDISNNDEEMINMTLMKQENEPLKFQQGTYNIKYQSL